MKASKEQKPQQSRVIQNMALTRKGFRSLLPIVKYFVGRHLLNNGNINNYINGPICHDAVVYTRYLLGSNITHNQLMNINGIGWLNQLNYTIGQQWQGNNIPAGRAVGFRDLNNNNFFHSSISLGGTTVRGINGHLLGIGWTNAGDCDLGRLQPINNHFHYHNPNNPGNAMDVWISNL